MKATNENAARAPWRLLAIALCSLLALGACDLFLDSNERVARADARIAVHDYRGAVIELKNALQSDPSHVPARLRLAQVEYQLGDVVSADKDLRRALELGAEPGASAELLARIQLALGRPRELLTQIDSGALELPPAARAIYRGQALLGLQMFAEAQRELAAVVDTDPRWPEAHIGVAEALAGQGKIELAVAELDRVLEREPESFDARLTRGTIRAKRGDFSAAAQDLEHARTLVDAALPVNPHVKLLAALTEVQLARGDAPGAAATHQELARLAPQSVVTLVLAARIAMSRQDYTLATATLQRALAAAPSIDAIHFLLGASLFAQGNFGQAEQHFAQVVQRSPENLEARKLLAQVQLRLGRADAAMQLLATAQGAEDPQLELLLGLAHLQKGNEASGIAHLERVIAARPDDPGVRLDLATAYLRSQRPDKAVALLSGINRASAAVREIGLLVAALQASGNKRQALSEVEALLAARPRDAGVLDLGAAYFASQGDFNKARGIAERAIALDPKNVASLLARARIETLAGDPAAAGQWLDKTIAIDAGNAPAHLGLAELAVGRGDLPAATRVLEALRKRDTSSIDARLRLVALYLQQRNATAAQPVIAEVAALGKERPEVLNALGTLFLDYGRYDEALLRFQAATLQDGQNPIYWLNTARAQITLGNSSIAREALEKAVAAQPGWIPAVGTLAMLDVKEGRGTAAIARVQELTTARPKDDAVLGLQGDVHMVMRDYAKAAASYEAAAALKPSSALAAKVFKARQSGKLADPTQPLEKWLASHPDDDTLRMVLADAYQRAGDRPKAVAQYETIETRGAATPILLNNLAWLYFEMGDTRAEAVARRAYEGAPDVAAVADTYGWILAEAGKAAQAVEPLRRAAADTNDPVVQYHLAVALIRTGARDEGRRRLTELLQRAPEFNGAAEARRLLESGG